MTQSIICKINSLRDMGLFSAVNGNDIPPLRRYNLVYGFNGSGKSTIARILRTYELCKPCADLPQGGTFELELSDGTKLSKQGVDTALKDRIVVFNQDFVEESFRWREARANPVFYIGAKQARLAEVLPNIIAHDSQRFERLNAAKSLLESCEKQFANFKKDRAAIIATQLNLGRRYVATHLENDYAAFSPSISAPLSESEIIITKATINRNLPKEKVAEISDLSLKISFFILADEVCAHALSSGIVEAIGEHSSMLTWVQQGFKYHSEKHMNECLFCGSPFTEERRQHLARVIDHSFNSLTNQIMSCEGELQAFKEKIQQFSRTLPSHREIDDEFESSYLEKIIRIGQELAELQELTSVFLSAIAEKKLRPNLQIQIGIENVSKVRNIAEKLEACIAQLNHTIKAHNRKHDEFSSEQMTCRQRLKDHLLLEVRAEYELLQKQVDSATKQRDLWSNLKDKSSATVDRLQRRLRSHGAAVEKINDLLSAYLGHSELSITTLEDGYQLTRNGKILSGTLSEGEKTALALCYFISKIEENGRQLKNTIVVIDDPISSLDTRALNYAFNLLKLAVAGAAQLFLLTHNLQFMNEVKKWLKSDARDKDRNGNPKTPTASLIFIETQKQPGSDKRISRLTQLPKLLRDYESEYHYLFWLILQSAQDRGKLEAFAYLLPNVLRKALEIFLAFRIPGPDGLDSKLKHSTISKAEVDVRELNALSRLSQTESHADNIDDIIGFSSMTVEETSSAVEAILNLMDKLDAEHLKRMKTLCEN